jgi:hypothetical protein
VDFFVALELLLEEGIGWMLAPTLVITLLAYFLAFRRRIRSVLDPLAYTLLFSALTTVLLIALWLNGFVSLGKASFAIAALTLFFAGFLLSDNPAIGKSHPRHAGPSGVTSAMLAVLFAVQLAILVTTYTLFGVPLFLESRLGAFVDSGGFGVLWRLTNGLEVATLILAFIVIRQGGHARAWGFANVLLFFVSAVLSGSKGALLIGLFSWYLAGVFQQRQWAVQGLATKKSLLALLTVFLAALFTLGVQYRAVAAGVGDILRLLTVRIAAEGDGYVYFFGHDLIDSLSKPDWLALVRPVLAALRIVPAETAVNPGFEVIGELLSIDAPTTGPNSRLPIYLLYFYGMGGLAIAPLLGLALGWARNSLLRASRRSAFQFSLLASVYFSMTKLEVDPQITVHGLLNLALAMPILYFAAQFMRRPAGGTHLQASPA